ncbi:MAG TPA: GHKL domain-containing protein, partial [Ferruginibacter sp.]|nr:GHKL domain-containing protein [Ferruginibacter sp.]
VRGFTLEPLLLIPFVENAFKHISQHPDKPNFIRGGMTMQGNRFRFLLENSQESDKKGAHPHSGIGLANVRRRLELLYPGRHDLRIQNDNGVFTVDLFIHV